MPSAEPRGSCEACPAPVLARARSAFAYTGPIAAAIRRLKFGGWREVGPVLGAAVAALDLPPVDVVTWVPLARRRLAARGYDQARVLAGAVARARGLEVRGLVRRCGDPGPQARRGAADRRRAMRGAFEPTAPAPRRVLLVDDVLTTGATAAACAEALRAAGAHAVVLGVVARSLPAEALRIARGDAYARGGPRPGLWLPGDPPR
jgi:predicted amidophosphoribosyltransferase